MPITAQTFAHNKALNSARKHRAYADVVIINPVSARRSATLQCLVDTGSDYTILPLSAASQLGITASGLPVTFRTAGGVSYTLPSNSSVALEIEGYLIQSSVVFSSTSGFIPILGRLQLVAAFDVGFDTTHWYWD